MLNRCQEPQRDESLCSYTLKNQFKAVSAAHKCHTCQLLTNDCSSQHATPTSYLHLQFGSQSVWCLKGQKCFPLLLITGVSQSGTVLKKGYCDFTQPNLTSTTCCLQGTISALPTQNHPHKIFTAGLKAICIPNFNFKGSGGNILAPRLFSPHRCFQPHVI